LTWWDVCKPRLGGMAINMENVSQKRGFIYSTAIPTLGGALAEKELRENRRACTEVWVEGGGAR